MNWIVLKAIIGLYFVFFGCCSPKIAGVVKVVGDHYDPRSCRMVGGREGWTQSDSVTIHCKFHSVFVSWWLRIIRTKIRTEGRVMNRFGLSSLPHHRMPTHTRLLCHWTKTRDKIVNLNLWIFCSLSNVHICCLSH